MSAGSGSYNASNTLSSLLVSGIRYARRNVDEKTIRRDLTFLRKVGFDVRVTIEGHNRKRWRLRTRFEAMCATKQKYRAIRDNLELLLDQAEQLQDQRLVDDLRALRRRVVRKCR